MEPTIEEMLQQQIKLIQDLAKAMKEVIESCEFFQEQNDELLDKVALYKAEFKEMKERILCLEGQNFKLRKSIWKLKSDFNCTCEGVDTHTCPEFK